MIKSTPIAIANADASETSPLMRHSGLKHDLNLLLVLRMLLETSNVSEAARRLDSSQPAVSRMLERLRQSLGDPLLIKGASRMTCTQRGHELKPLLGQLATLLEQIYRVPQDYRLDEVERTCVIGLNDSLQAVMGPTLLRKFREMAPRSSVKLVPLSHHNPRQAVLDGGLDVMIGMSSSEESQLRREQIILCGYICVSSTDHPLRRKSLTIADLATRPYLEASNTGILTALTDEMFRRAGVQKKPVAAISSFLAVAEVILNTNIVCILPRYLEHLLASRPGICCTPVVANIEPHSVSMYWHNSKHFDPFFGDVRDLVVEVGELLNSSI